MLARRDVSCKQNPLECPSYKIWTTRSVSQLLKCLEKFISGLCFSSWMSTNPYWPPWSWFRFLTVTSGCSHMLVDGSYECPFVDHTICDQLQYFLFQVWWVHLGPKVLLVSIMFLLYRILQNTVNQGIVYYYCENLQSHLQEWK